MVSNSSARLWAIELTDQAHSVLCELMRLSFSPELAPPEGGTGNFNFSLLSHLVAFLPPAAAPVFSLSPSPNVEGVIGIAILIPSCVRV